MKATNKRIRIGAAECDCAVFGLGGDAQDGEHEHEGEDDFNEERKPDIAFVKAVLTESFVAAQKRPEHGGACGCACELGNDVADKIAERDLAAYKHRKADRGVDMAARNVADGIRHRDDDETERQGREKIAGKVAERALAHHGRAACEQHEHEGAYEFRQILFE